LFVQLRLALTSSDFLHHRDDSWCASIAIRNGGISLYENFWTDHRGYICQYDREYGIHCLLKFLYSIEKASVKTMQLFLMNSADGLHHAVVYS